MNLKKSKIISIIFIFLLCFLFHFVYELLPCTITAIFFPVNESIWEHIKMIYTAIIFNGFVEYIILKKSNVQFNNFTTSLFISALTMIPIFLIIYLPLYNIFGPKFMLNIGIMLIVIIISQIISFYILKSKKNSKLDFISLLLIMISFVVFSYLTYHTPKVKLFYDIQKQKYGINNYNV